MTKRHLTKYGVQTHLEMTINPRERERGRERSGKWSLQYAHYAHSKHRRSTGQLYSSVQIHIRTFVLRCTLHAIAYVSVSKVLYINGHTNVLHAGLCSTRKSSAVYTCTRTHTYGRQNFFKKLTFFNIYLYAKFYFGTS